MDMRGGTTTCSIRDRTVFQGSEYELRVGQMTKPKRLIELSSCDLNNHATSSPLPCPTLCIEEGGRKRLVSARDFAENWGNARERRVTT